MPLTASSYSSTLAWKIPWTEEPGRLQSMGSLRVGHDWAILLCLLSYSTLRQLWPLNYNPSPDAYMRSLQCLPLESLFILSVEPSFCNYFSFFVFVLCLFLCTQVSDLFPVSKQSHSRRWFGVILCWVCSKYSISCAPNSYSSIYLFLAGCQFHWKLEPWLILCIPSVYHGAWCWWYLVSQWMDGWGVENKQSYFNIIFYDST